MPGGTTGRWPWRGGSHVNDEGTQLVLLQRDDFMVARLLGQLQQGTSRCQPQPGHVGFTEGGGTTTPF